MLDHVALVVTSLDASTEFYTRLLGVERLNRVDLGDHHIQYLSSGTGVRIELIEYVPGRAPGALSEPDAIAMRHLAWEVPDVAAAAAFAEATGGQVINPPTVVPALGFTSALIRDPDGIEVELLQR